MLDFFITKWSYFGIIAVLILTGCGLPIPEEVPIVLAGVLSQRGTMDVWLAFASCLIGAIMGDCVMYGIGYHWGHNLLKEHPRFAHFLHAEREAGFEEAIQNHGLKVMLLARFMVGLRSPVYLAAGIVRIPFRRFILMDLLCATLVVGSFFALSYHFGDVAIKYLRNFEIGLTSLAVVGAVLVVGYFFWRRRTRIVQRVLGPEMAEAALDEDSAEAAPSRKKTEV